MNLPSDTSSATHNRSAGISSKVSESNSRDARLNFKVVLLAGFILAVITSIPQIHLCYVRGSAWNGTAALLDTDELPYQAYTNALIAGRPRRNDPYAGKDGGSSETLFSIQFLPPYVVALPARVLNISVETAFIILLPLAVFATVLVLWKLLFELTSNTLLAAVGAVCVISLGTAAAHSPLQIIHGLETGYDPFPFLRRYIPAVPFPILIALTLFVWRALTKNVAWAIAAGLSFVFLIYSYWFLWTAAFAWTVTILTLWFIARPGDRMKVGYVAGLMAVLIAPALVPYIWLLSNRVSSMDSGQILEATHAPDLLRAPEIYGGLIILLFAYQIIRKVKSYDRPDILFTLSFAIAPFLVFNQQILTGKSLQPFHYEEFATNYWVMIAFFLTLAILRTTIPKRIIAYFAVGGIGTAIMLSVFGIRIMGSSNIRFDEVRGVVEDLKRTDPNGGVVFATDRFLTHSISAISNKPVLWARYLYTFSNINLEQQKARYFQYLYYSGFTERQLEEALRKDFTSRWEVFGAERANPVLTKNFSPITDEEIFNAVREYKLFVESYDHKLAVNPILSYAIVSPTDDLSNLDRWYERNAGDKSGEFIIYTLRPRNSANSPVISFLRR